MKGKLHVYTGNGKGKTTAAMGLALRSLGHGRRVLIAQFLKDGRSGELAALCTFEQATIYPAKPISGFVFAMSPEEKEEAARQQNAQAADIQKTAEAIQPALTVLDELNVALSCGMVTQENAEKLIDAGAGLRRCGLNRTQRAGMAESARGLCFGNRRAEASV